MDASTFAAWWGAGTGTLALVWKIFRWFRSGVKLRVSASPDMQVITPDIGIDETLWVSVNVRNVGDAATTLTHFCGVCYRNWLDRLRRKTSGRFVMTTGPESPIPHKLGPGETWSGMVLQEQVAAAAARTKGQVFLGVQHSMAEKLSLTRVIIPVSDG